MNKYSQSFSRRTILVIGRRLTPLDVRTWTERTSPSSLVLTLSTTPSGQFPREVDSSTINTSSFGLRLESILIDTVQAGGIHAANAFRIHQRDMALVDTTA